jgi:hypothetical protein
MPDIRVDSPIVHVSAPEFRMPDQPAPIVHVTVPAPVVNVAAAEVFIPESPAPVVNVTVPSQPVTVTAVVPPRRTEMTVERDDDGLIRRIDRVEVEAGD